MSNGLCVTNVAEWCYFRSALVRYSHTFSDPSDPVTTTFTSLALLLALQLSWFEIALLLPLVRNGKSSEDVCNTATAISVLSGSAPLGVMWSRSIWGTCVGILKLVSKHFNMLLSSFWYILC